MQRVLALLVVMLALSGCGHKDKLSQADMEGRIDAALAGLEADLGPSGRISGADLTIPVEAGFGTVSLPLTMQVGTAGDLFFTGSFGLFSSKVEIEAYCDHERLIVVTDGMANVDAEAEDISIEARNSSGSCLHIEGDVSEYLGGFAGIQDLVEGSGRLEPASFKHDDGTIEGVYIDLATDARITITVDGDRLQRIAASSGESELVMDLHYGERTAITPPIAKERVPAPVSWEVQAFDDRAEVDITSGQHAIEDHHIRVYDRDAAIPCSGGPAPLVTFDLADGAKQTRQGIRMELRDDGDGILDTGDKVFLFQEGIGDGPWRHKVEVWDAWSDTSADPFCSIPGPAPAVVGGLLIVTAAVLRRRF